MTIKPWVRRCEACGEQFEATDGRQRRCSSVCEVVGRDERLRMVLQDWAKRCEEGWQ